MPQAAPACAKPARPSAAETGESTTPARGRGWRTKPGSPLRLRRVRDGAHTPRSGRRLSPATPLRPGTARALPAAGRRRGTLRSEEHTSELQSLMRISYAVFCLKKKKQNNLDTKHTCRITRPRQEQKTK